VNSADSCAGVPSAWPGPFPALIDALVCLGGIFAGTLDQTLATCMFMRKPIAVRRPLLQV